MEEYDRMTGRKTRLLEFALQEYGRVENEGFKSDGECLFDAARDQLVCLKVWTCVVHAFSVFMRR
jgi:hypothetical protein